MYCYACRQEFEGWDGTPHRGVLDYPHNHRGDRAGQTDPLPARPNDPDRDDG